MLVLFPVIFLLLTCLALAVVNRIQPGFRSNWLLAVAGTLLSALALIVLRFRVPLNVELSGFALGADLLFPISFGLNAFTWPLALAVPILLLTGLFSETRQAMSVTWSAWMQSLLLAAAGILAVLSGNLLAFALAYFLLDLITFSFHVGLVSEIKERGRIVLRFAVGLAGVLAALAAWSLELSDPRTSVVFLLLATAVRLGLFAPRLFVLLDDQLRRDLALMLGLASPLSALALLSLWKPLAGASQVLVLLFLVLAGLAVFVWRSPRRWLPAPLLDARERAFSFDAFGRLGAYVFKSVEWVLKLIEGLLEGEAGVLWALLLIALLLSLVSQFGLGS